MLSLFFEKKSKDFLIATTERLVLVCFIDVPRNSGSINGFQQEIVNFFHALNF